MSTPETATMNGRRGLWRWAVALVATVALVISGSSLVAFAQSGSGESQGPVFVPAGAAMYAEARLDMPAGQNEALAQMLTAFPGFADTGSFDMKVEELIAGLSGEMGMALPVDDLFGDVLTGEIGMSLSGLESAMMGAEPAALIGAAVADDDAAAEFMATVTASGMGEMTEQMYNDVAIISDETRSVALHDGWMLFSPDVEQVKAAIDTLDGTTESLAADADFAAAWSRVPAGHLGAAWMDAASLAPLLEVAGTMAEGQAGMSMPDVDLAALLPEDVVAWLAAESDRLNLEFVATPSDTMPEVPVGDSELASLYPADTQLYLEVREAGSTVETALTGLSELLAEQQAMLPDDDEMGSMGGLSDIEMLFGEESPIAAILGVPLPQVIDFVSDLSVGAGLSSDGLWLGIAAEVIDEAEAEDRIDDVTSLIRLFGADPESGVSVATDTVGGVEVTTITLPLDEATAEAGLPVALGDTVSVAVADGYVLLGLGGFVESVLLSDGGDSLATSAGYQDALGEDTVNSGVMYVDLQSLIGVLDPMLAMSSPEWEEMSPYAAGLDRMIMVGSAEDDVLQTRMTVIANQ